MVTQERLKELFTCDWDTGEFTRLVKRGRFPAGSVAGYPDDLGYIRISIDRKNYLAHRLAWFYFFEEWPSDLIDHIDGNRSNNGIDNLREATTTENNFNVKSKRAHNTTGYKGVFRNKNGDRFCAKTVVNKKQIYLGTYDTAEEAFEAYNTHTKTLHGEFYANSN